MSIVAHETTVPAYPLGIPVDGRDRYSMTREQACVYCWLVKHRPHDRAFLVNFREVGEKVLCSLDRAFDRVSALVERGWLTHDGRSYRFVHPVMKYGEPK